MKILKDIKNELLRRRELEIGMEKDSTPNFEEVKKNIEEEFKVSGEHIKVDSINGRFGRKAFVVSASIYHDKPSLEKMRTKTRKQRKAEEEEKKKTEEAKIE